MYKQVLHDHLDGGLRPSTAKELAKHINYKPINEIDDVAKFFDRSSSTSLEDYLEALETNLIKLEKYEEYELCKKAIGWIEYLKSENIVSEDE